MLARSHSKWRVAAEHGEDRGRQAIDIRCYRGRSTLEELRRDVGQGSDHLLRGGLAATRHARNAEVAKLRFPVSSEQDISGLDIAMKYARPVSGFQSARQAHPYLQGLANPEWSVTADPGTERVSTVILHHDVWTPGKGSTAVQYGHDVRVAGDP